MKYTLPFFLIFVCASMLAHTAFALDTSAKQAYLIDINTQSVLLKKDANALMHPSSMSKLMTVYIAFSRLKEGRVALDSPFKVSEKAWRMQGSKSFVELGSEITVDELLRGIIVQSGNDACVVIAEGISGSEDAFVKEMNVTAKALGMEKTHFVNASGMPDDAHLSTAHDLTILSSRLILDFPEYYDYFAIREYTYNNIRQFNRNSLLGSIGVDGLKTGHTEAGGYGIALSAKQDGRRLVLVINGMESEKERIKEGDKLLRWGFREFENYTLITKGQRIAQAELWYGTQEQVGLIADSDLLITLPVNEDQKVRYTLRYEGPVATPIAKGDKVADLLVKIPGYKDTIIPLIAETDVASLSGMARLFANLHYYLIGRDQ